MTEDSKDEVAPGLGLRACCGSCEKVYSITEHPDACPSCKMPFKEQFDRRWELHTEVDLQGGRTLVVSSVNLIVETSRGFFETMIWRKDIAELTGYTQGSIGAPEYHWTRKEAERSHREVCQLLAKDPESVLKEAYW